LEKDATTPSNLFPAIALEGRPAASRAATSSLRGD